jgi:hypothetical protein
MNQEQLPPHDSAMARNSISSPTLPQSTNTSFISYNFHFAKVAALLAVIVGHYAQTVHHPSSTFLWIPTQIGLYVFGFSSGYFTGNKYRMDYSLNAFWLAKVPRLLGPLLVADVFLIALLLLQDQAQVFHWHSLFALFGLNGVFLWLGIPSQTPLGNGLWFFTLLWAFYLIFPCLERLNRTKAVGISTVTLGGILSLILAYQTSFGVAFWDTAWFFLFGTFCGRHLGRIHPTTSGILVLIGLTGIPIAKFVFHDSSLLTPLMMLLGIGVVGSLTATPISRWGSRWVMAASALLFEMYVIHTYLFIPVTLGTIALNFSTSLLLVVGMAFILRPAGRALGKRMQEFLCNTFQSIN